MRLQRIREGKKAVEGHPASTLSTGARVPPGLSDSQGHGFSSRRASPKNCPPKHLSVPHPCGSGSSARMTIPSLCPSFNQWATWMVSLVGPTLLGARFGTNQTHAVPVLTEQIPRCRLFQKIYLPMQTLNLLGRPPPSTAKFGCATAASHTGQPAPWGQGLRLTPLEFLVPSAGSGI